MTIHRIQIIFTTFVLTLCSCATIFNAKKTNVIILTNVPSKLTIGKDTMNNLTTYKSLTVERNKKPLIVTAYNDSLTKTVIIKSKNSFAYWLNSYPNWLLCTGFYIDTKTNL